jgi:hypothetical protein
MQYMLCFRCFRNEHNHRFACEVVSMLGKARFIGGKFSCMLQELSLTSVWGYVWDLLGVPGGRADETIADDAKASLESTREMIVLMVLEGACDYHQRILGAVDSFPLRCAWLASFLSKRGIPRFTFAGPTDRPTD